MLFKDYKFQSFDFSKLLIVNSTKDLGWLASSLGNKVNLHGVSFSPGTWRTGRIWYVGIEQGVKNIVEKRTQLELR